MGANKSIKIGHHTIGDGYPPLVIAEMSGNHNQSLDRSLQIVEAAAKAGAHALKLQTYTADTITLDVEDGDFFISDPMNTWKGQSLYKLYQQAYTPWEWHAPIMQRCRELGMVVFSTPFDESAVDFLLELDVPAFKIASFENNHLPLIRKVARTRKPVIISTGMATIAELDEAVRTIRDEGCEDFILLKCTSAYPASKEDINLKTIPHLRELFDCNVGLSDHTMGVGVSVASVALGATVLEKHFTLCRADGGVDAAFSLEPEELTTLVEETKNAWLALGRVSYGATEKEKTSMVFRRSLYVAEDMKAGETFTAKNLRIVRPGHGLQPKFFEIVLGKKIKKNTKKGTALTWDLME